MICSCMRAAVRFAGLFDALAGPVEMPAMKRAAQAVVLAPAMTQISAAMRAMTPDQAELTFIVAKQHQVFAQQAHRHDRARAFEFIAQGSGLPVLPHQFSARRAGTGLGDEVVYVFRQHRCTSCYWSGAAHVRQAARIAQVPVKRFNLTGTCAKQDLPKPGIAGCMRIANQHRPEPGQLS